MVFQDSPEEWGCDQGWALFKHHNITQTQNSRAGKQNDRRQSLTSFIPSQNETEERCKKKTKKNLHTTDQKKKT